MAYTVYTHLIRDSQQDVGYNFSGQLVRVRIDRSYFVGDIDDQNTSKEVMDAAVNEIRTNWVAPGADHPNYAGAKAINYRANPLAADNAAEVIVSFVYDFGGIPTQYSIEIAGGLQSVVTNASYDSSNNLVPMFVSYNVDWHDPETNSTPPAGSTFVMKPATATVLRPVSTMTITKSISEDVADDLEDALDVYLGRTNASPFRNKPTRTVLCQSIVRKADPFSAFNIGQIVLGYRPETWDEYARVTSTQYGTPSNIWLAKGSGSPTYAANGISKFKDYPTANLSDLLNILDG